MGPHTSASHSAIYSAEHAKCHKATHVREQQSRRETTPAGADKPFSGSEGHGRAGQIKETR